MRFRTRVISIGLFLKVMQTLERIGKTAVLRFAPDSLQFILVSSASDGVQVWVRLNVASLFEDYRIESLNNNVISLEVNLDQLCKGLRSGATSFEMFLKLVKRDNLPHLNITMNVQMGQRSMAVVQDVPVRVLTVQENDRFTEPNLPHPDVHIMMPALKSVKQVMERLKNLSDYLIIQSNMAGQLTFKVQTDTAAMAVFYKNLEHPQIEGQDVPVLDASKKAEIRVDLRKFLRFLYADTLNPTHVVCCLVSRRALVMHVVVGDVYLTYYIPILAETVNSISS